MKYVKLFENFNCLAPWWHYYNELVESGSNRKEAALKAVEKFPFAKEDFNEIIKESTQVHDLIDEYLPEAPDNLKDDLNIFINNNIDCEASEIERLMQIISKLSKK